VEHEFRTQSKGVAQTGLVSARDEAELVMTSAQIKPALPSEHMGVQQ
jgi:hypothetical protein